MSPTIFISYASEDREHALRFYSDMLREGMAPWLDVVCLQPGERWRDAISAAIRESQYFVALLSESSVTKRGYVQKELAEALEVLKLCPASDIFIVPVRLSECQPSRTELTDIHWVDLFPAWDAGIQKISRSFRGRDTLNSLIFRRECVIETDSTSTNEILEAVAVVASELLSVPKDLIFGALYQREQVRPTNVGGGLWLPHCSLSEISRILVMIVRLENKINYGIFGEIDVAFVLITPDVAYQGKLVLLIALTGEQGSLVSKVRGATDGDEIYELAAEQIDRYHWRT